MKKTFSLVLSIVLVISLITIPVSADGFDPTEFSKANSIDEIFGKLPAPENPTVTKEEDGNCLNVTYTRDFDFSTISPYLEGARNYIVGNTSGMSFLDKIIYKKVAEKVVEWKVDITAPFETMAQIDWAIDNSEDMKYTAIYDSFGYDADLVRRAGSWAYTYETFDLEKTTDTATIFADELYPNDPDDIEWNGNDEFDGWKKILKEGQYTVSDDGMACFDWKGHSLFVRVRYGVSVVFTQEAGYENNKKTYFSAWSDATEYTENEGKAFEVSESSENSEESGDVQVPSETSESVLVGGDSNEDGKLDMKDVLLTRKYIASIVQDIHVVLADANADGHIDMKDVLLVRKFLAGFDVTIPSPSL